MLAVSHLVREEEIAGTAEAESALTQLPPLSLLSQRYPDIASFVQRLDELRQLRRRHAGGR